MCGTFANNIYRGFSRNHISENNCRSCKFNFRKLKNLLTMTLFIEKTEIYDPTKNLKLKLQTLG